MNGIAVFLCFLTTAAKPRDSSFLPHALGEDARAFVPGAGAGFGLEQGTGSGVPASAGTDPESTDERRNGLPGAAPFDPALARKVREALRARGPSYRPRTRHLTPEGDPRYTNRLILETSPYLIQHAHNPVNWYPWGDEAFEAAKRLARPVLLSVGYSTCHWCHVMEEESFEDEEIARFLNENYVAIKVDREERPDLDGIYMSAVQALTGGGGWPMTVWLTTDKRPFFGGTYFPARDGDRGSRIGFLTLLRRMRETHGKEGNRIAESAAALTEAIRRDLAPPLAGILPGAGVLDAAGTTYRASFDPAFGGLNRAPKFPSSLPVRLLLRLHRRTGDAEMLRMAALTLEKMAAGGLHDQIGGGFHRYSTDQRWLVPHFEKMLYDQALLAVAYLEAYQVTSREEFARTADGILRYVAREMTSPEGAFYSATDADSPAPDGRREEGWYFTWTPEEVRKAVGPSSAPIVLAYYGVTPAGNFEGGRSILHVAKPIDEVARDLGIRADRARRMIEEAREPLLRARATRPPPIRDDKILTAWNGLMISAFARAAQVLGSEEEARRAERAADFILRRLRTEGRLLRSFQGGRAQHAATLSDYAFFGAALLDLFEATGNPRWLREAIALDSVLERHYADADRGGFFLTADDHEKLLAREKPASDGAEPSGNSVAALNLLRLAELTGEDRYRSRAERTIRAFGGILSESPTGLSEMLLAIDFLLDTPKEIVIVTPSRRSEAEPLLSRLRPVFLPNRTLVVGTEAAIQALARIVPLAAERTALGGRATAYVCEKRVCRLPTSDPEEFTRQLKMRASLIEPTKRP